MNASRSLVLQYRKRFISRDSMLKFSNRLFKPLLRNGRGSGCTERRSCLMVLDNRDAGEHPACRTFQAVNRHGTKRPRCPSDARTPFMAIRAVLFDIDGTLVDSNDMHVLAWEEAFAGVGATFERQTIHDQIGKGTDMLVPALLPEANEAVQEKLGDAQGQVFKAKFLDTVKPFPGATRALSRAARRARSGRCYDQCRRRREHQARAGHFRDGPEEAGAAVRGRGDRGWRHAV
jgi:hypothetical protein